MKRFLYFSVAALALTSCGNDEFLGSSPADGSGAVNPNDVIAFGGSTLRPTRAQVGGSEAAEKLNNNFVVYGFKTTAEDEDAAAGTGDQKVFGRYNVNYEAGTANTTESNTNNWEYVGYTSLEEQLQTIKYWDLSAKSYVFSAVSGTGIKAEKILSGATKYDKGWTVTIPAGGSLSDLYASDRVVMTKEGTPASATGKVDGAYKDVVNLTFRALGTKIRFAMYETVPGYSVHIDKVFYYTDNANPTTTQTVDKTNFAIQGNFRTANADKPTPLTVTYYNETSGIENRPKVRYETEGDNAVTTSIYGVFGANLQATPAIGTSSVEATYDQSDKSYTMILPYESLQESPAAENPMKLKVTYTLTSTDGSNEEITVHAATAVVPTNFNQWKPNFAYTYIFKISDNTNGTTVTPGDPDDPDDPDPDDPDAGLFPITFDAVVITDETDVQETITSVSDPSITTYQKGVIVTENDEYVAGDDIYFENGTANIGNYKVYEVNNFGTEATIEEVVANWKNNYCVLTEVAVTRPTADNEEFIPLTDGTYIKKSPTQAAKFTPVAGKTYVIADNVLASAAHYKVVKVADGTAAARDYTLTQKTDGTAGIVAEWTEATNAVHYQLLSDNTATDKGAFGAKALIKVYNGSGDDVTSYFDIDDTAILSIYSIKPNAAAFAAGKIENGAYTVKVVSKKDDAIIAEGDATFVVNYVIADNTVTITAGENEDITPTIAGATVTKATIAGVPAGIIIKETATAGTYNVAVGPEVAGGAYDITFAGKTVTITVESYAFVESRTFTLDYAGNALQQTLFLTKNVTEYADVEVTDMTGIDEAVAKIIKSGAGIYAVVPMGPGSYTVKYKNASAVITVYQYVMNDASVKKSTGKATLTVSLNGGSYNALTSALKIYNDSDVDVTSNFTVTANGKNIVLSDVKSTLAAGDYTAKYTVDGTVVAQSTITVTE